MPVQSDKSLFGTPRVVKDQKFLYTDSKHSDQTVLMERLIWVWSLNKTSLTSESIFVSLQQESIQL